MVDGGMMNCPALAPPSKHKPLDPAKIGYGVSYSGMGMDQVGLDIITDLSSPKSLVSPSHLQLKSLVFFYRFLLILFVTH